MTMEALGVSFGAHGAFYAADRWNARGYYERRDVMDINNRMITGFRRTGSRAAALAGQAVYLSEPRLDRIVERGGQFGEGMRKVRHETGDGAIKDPRLCLTWSAWAQHVNVDRSVVCIRHPFEVADSLRRRQRIPMQLGFRFWRYHVRALREATPPDMVVVDLESLTSDPKSELGMLVDGLELDIETDEAVQRFHKAYEPGLAKVSSPEARPTLDGETRGLWEWVVGLRPIPMAGRIE